MSCDTGAACSSECWNTRHDNNPNHGAGNTDPNTGGCDLSSCMAGCSVCSTSCGNGCKGGCSGCSGDCSSGCSGGCDGCRGTCSSGCSGDCKTACARACSQSCTTSCTRGCSGQCNYGCQNEEVDSLYAKLALQRVVRNEDINLIKKIIYRLFEIRDQSSIKNNTKYISEYTPTEEDIYGLIPDTVLNENLQLAFTKTFQNIINNLNNVNTNRITINQQNLIPEVDDKTGIEYNLMDREVALYWINCLKKIYNAIAPIS